MSLTAVFVCEAWIDDRAVPTGERIEFEIGHLVRAMTEADRDALWVKLSGISPDLDFLAEQTGVAARHDGPFTVRVDEAAFADFVTAGMPGGRYVVTEDVWTHIFDEAVGEIPTQWVYDLEKNCIVSAIVASNRSLNNASWSPATPAQLADLEDSVKGANEEALEKPEDWGCAFSDTLPEFAGAAPSAKPGTRKIALVAVAFDDPDDSLQSTSDFATFVEVALGRSVRGVSATVYTGVDALQADIADGIDPFAVEMAAGALELENDFVPPAATPGI